MNIEKEWTTKAGYLARIVYNKQFGGYCGYVGVPEGHTCYGSDYDSVNLDVHGGLTFAGRFKDTPDGLWMLGYDCGHFGDSIDEQNLEYNINECERLAEQLAEKKIKNKDRAARIKRVLQENWEVWERPADIIADIMHYCDQKGIVFDQELALGLEFFQEEVSE